MRTPDHQLLIDTFLRDDAGSPLGPGMPSGSPLRVDGESHYDAWLALARRDPCAYCADAGSAGTVDHVEPRSRAARGLGTPHGWINTVGACVRCNGAKRDLGLLIFLYLRRWSGAPLHPVGPARAKWRLARRRRCDVAARPRAGRAGARGGSVGS